MVHGTIMEIHKKEKNLKDIYFGLQLIQIKSVPTNKSLSLSVQLMENSTFHHQRLHENEKVVIINHILRLLQPVKVILVNINHT